jgi:trans-aconitate 2-methyltransferase
VAHRWDPDVYLRYADERGRPFTELLARVDVEKPSVVVDLGCGTGNLTALLKQRWPTADVHGVDSSAEMIAKADTSSGVSYEVADLREWEPTRPVDVLVSNATLQWVPGHLELLPRLVGYVRGGGWLAFQVPGNFEEPSHASRRELERDPRFAPHLVDVHGPAAFDAATYLAALADLGLVVDAWETTYLHVLQGDDPVFDWVVGTGARPTLQALSNELRSQFEDEYRSALCAAYPSQPWGTVLPFRRIFVVARKPSA